MISGQTLRVCPEGKPVPTHRVVARGHAFPDHALAPFPAVNPLSWVGDSWPVFEGEGGMRCESSWPCSSFCPSSTFGTGITTTANYWMGWTACDAPSPTACFIERPSSERHTTGLPRRVRGAIPGLETNAETRPKPLISKVEATSGIEPEYTVLQFYLSRTRQYRTVPLSLFLLVIFGAVP